MDNGTISIVDPKNKINRHAFMTEEVKVMFKGRTKGQAKSELVFPAVNGKRRRWVPDTFARTIDALGLNDTGEFMVNENGKMVPVKIIDARQRVVFHSLRHSYASWLVMDGVPLYTVAELMGHSDLEMTRRYSHLAPDTLRKSALIIEGALDPKPAKVIPFNKAQNA
jgi:integrase